MKILTNFPYSPFTRQAGSGERFLQNILGLRDLGYQVTIWSIEHESLYKWKEEDLAIAKREGFEVKLTPTWDLPPDFLEGIDVIWCVYYNFVEKYLNSKIPIVCDMHDLLSCNEQINELFKEHVRKIGFKNTFRYSPSIFRIPSVTDFPISEEELTAYKNCHKVITISQHETTRLQNHRISTTYIPFSPNSDVVTNEQTIPNDSYRGGLPIYAGSANLNNLFANDYLGEILIPKIRLKCPRFEMNMVGEIDTMCFKYPWINYEGYRQNINWQLYSFLWSPLLYGTGAKIKLGCSLASGLPAICFSSQRDGFPVVCGETGYSVDTQEEFIERAIELWNDRKLCARMGRNAYEAMQSFYPKENHLRDLQNCLNDVKLK